ncbi:MAG: plastocyanin/azurin family copper-binding protein [Gemmatimonadaceae bacterium]
MRVRASLLSFVLTTATLASFACGGGEKSAADSAAASPATPAPPVVAGQLTPKAGHKVITVEMITDDQGNNRFVPSDITADDGDVLRFTLVVGVHNVHFVADSNKSITTPPPSELLQIPGQTHDMAVDWPDGRYYFQCDPHALLGMVGHLTVK